MRILYRLAALVVAAAQIAPPAWAAGYPLHITASPDADGIWSVVAHNAGSSPVYLSVSLKNKVNVRLAGMSTGGTTKALEPGAKETLIVATADKPEEPMRFDYESKWVFGRGMQRGEHTGLYRPPFPADLTFETLNDLSEKSRTERTARAISILMPEGTPVICARTGFVMDTSGRLGDPGTGQFPYYEPTEKQGTYIRIVHDDGTWAEYKNLQQGSMTVQPGQKVEAGSQIALSGAANGNPRPNLQFVILKPNSGLSEPVSQPFKMDMAGRGILSVVAGDTIGASASVLTDASVNNRDPLVIAAVKQGEVNSRTGVYTAGLEHLTSQKTLLLFGAVAPLLLIGGVAIFLIRRRRVSDSWRSVFRFSRQKPPPVDASGNSYDQHDEPTQSRDYRPTPGYFTADWEHQFTQSVALALPPGFAVHHKVALNRLFPRPTLVRSQPAVLGILRGESFDIVVVDEATRKIVLVIEATRERPDSEDYRAAHQWKRTLLRMQNIPYLEVDPAVGPNELLEKASKLAKLSAGHIDVRPLQPKVAFAA